MATVPASALKNIEVLRDGASAQYGSDAMAGVINFILKDNSEGGSLTIDQGEFFEGDGAMTTVLGNIGLPLGDSGFLSDAGEFNEADRTNRGKQYCQSWWCVDPEPPGFTSMSAAKQAALKIPRIKLTTKMLTPLVSPRSFSHGDSPRLKPLAYSQTLAISLTLTQSSMATVTIPTQALTVTSSIGIRVMELSKIFVDQTAQFIHRFKFSPVVLRHSSTAMS